MIFDYIKDLSINIDGILYGIDPKFLRFLSCFSLDLNCIRARKYKYIYRKRLNF